MKIALVHDYLSQDGGAERVLKAMHEIWPEAPVFVLIHDQKKINYINQKKIKQSFLAYLPGRKKFFQWYLPIMPLATERHNLHKFDIVISSTSAFAKGVLTRPDTMHISYCHTPPRYLWTDTHEYLEELQQPRFIKIFLPGIIHRLRMWDKMSVDRVDYFISNSHTVRQRINKYYRRESKVINPAIEIDKFKISKKIDNYFITGGRLVPYKRFDLVISAFNRSRQPLKIFGIGPELKKLKQMSKNNIEFLGRVSEKEKINLLSKAQAFIHPQLEDFGITPIESMACGRPVIALGQGGALETIIKDKTGLFFTKQTWEHLLKTLYEFKQYSWDSIYIQSHARKFDKKKFQEKLKNFVDSRYEKFKQGLQQPSLTSL